MLEQTSSDNSSPKQSTKVAVLASTEDHCQHLQGLLEKSGLDVVLSQEAKTSSLENINNTTPDVLLIDISEDDDAGWDFVDRLSEQSDIPILFNDSGNNGSSITTNNEMWAKKLARKLTFLAHGNGPEIPVLTADQPFPLSSSQPLPAKSATKKKVPTATDTRKTQVKASAEDILAFAEGGEMQLENNQLEKHTDVTRSEAVVADLNVWVLGASLGGPQAVRQFLATISEDLPVAFILAQHIGANHINLLAEQLNRVTAFTVIPGKNGHRLRHGEVILTPADKEISFTDDGYLALRPAPPNAIYSPSIDNVMIEVARRFGEKAGTIVFSGMGDDGTHGCEAIAEHKGIVWAQDIASCVVSSMPDHARKTGAVSFSANPEQLAEHLHKFYCG